MRGSWDAAATHRDEAIVHERLHRTPRLLQRNLGHQRVARRVHGHARLVRTPLEIGPNVLPRKRPVHQVEIELLDAQIGERALASRADLHTESLALSILNGDVGLSEVALTCSAAWFVFHTLLVMNNSSRDTTADAITSSSTSPIAASFL
jgi:hypothetical protein